MAPRKLLVNAMAPYPPLVKAVAPHPPLVKTVAPHPPLVNTMTPRTPLILMLVLVLCPGVTPLHQLLLQTDVQLRWLARQVESSWSYYLPMHADPDSPCGLAIVSMAESLLNPNGSDWAARMVDSWPKYPDGMISGNWKFEGAYDECVTTADPQGTTRGKYCRLTVRRSRNDGEGKISQIAKVLGDHLNTHGVPSMVDGVEYGLKVSYGTCIPSQCTEQQLEDSLLQSFGGNTTVSSIFCYVESPDVDLKTSDIGYIVALACLGTIMAAALVTDVYILHTQDSRLSQGPLKFLLVFSPYTNMQKLFHINPDPPAGTISCLNGMRVMSMFWVIWGHQQSVADWGFINKWDAVKITNGFWYQMVSNAYLSVDTFFFLSGLLLSYNLLKELKRTNFFNPIIFYLHRILRLVPPILVVWGLYGTIARFFVTGPWAFIWLKYWYPDCNENGWKDVVMANNFNYHDGKNSCLGQMWYVSVDTQLFLVAPLLILPLHYFQVLGEAWLYVVLLVTIIIPASLIYDYQLPPAIILGTDIGEYIEKVYLTPWCRAGPWVVGIWLGHVLFQQGRTKATLSKRQVLAGWTVSTLTALLLVFGLYSYNQLIPKAKFDRVTAVVYGGLHRSVWAASLAWVVYACHNGYGGFMDSILGHPVWQPLSRLTYTIYLLAQPFQYLLSFQTRVPFYVTQIEKIIETVSATVICAPIAILVTLVAESPILGLEKLLLRPSAGPGNTKTNGCEVKGDGIILMVEKETQAINEKEKGNDNPMFTVDIQQDNTTIK